jgi:LmbE family N-acetylglucosaminyl deacetylase
MFHHLFISPHLDDAVLSCGGLIDALTKQGDVVDVFTLMAGDAPDPLPESPLIEKIHGRWDRGDNPIAARRSEDHAAIELLGGTPYWHDWRDCIYRVNSDGRVLYQSDDDIFGNIHPDDPLANATIDLRRWTKVNCIYAPLGAGNHVDHQLVRQAVVSWFKQTRPSMAIFFYEEYPYSSETGEVSRSHSGQKKRLQGATAIQAARALLTFNMRPEFRALDEIAIQHKIDAIACYSSQISTFWEDDEEMTTRVRQNAHSVGQGANLALAERLWAVQ